MTKTDLVEIKNRTINDEKVPNVLGMSLRDGLFLLEKSGLKVSFKGNGMIVKQSIPPGSQSVKGNAIELELS